MESLLSGFLEDQIAQISVLLSSIGKTSREALISKEPTKFEKEDRVRSTHFTNTSYSLFFLAGCRAFSPFSLSSLSGDWPG